MDHNSGDIFSGIPFGRWNLLYITVICLQQAASPAQYFSSIFIDMPMNFRCSTNGTIQTNATFDNACSVTVETKYGYLRHNCSTFEFDKSPVSSTLSSEFQLVCDKAWMASIYSVLFPIGCFVGNFFLGASDKWGRVTVIQISSTIYACGGLIIGLASYEHLILLGRFLVGLTSPIVSGSAIPLCHETISPKHRSTVGYVIYLPFYVFVVFLGVMAYYIRNWRMLYLITSFPMYLIPIIALFLDKSPRWLIQQGRVDEATIVMQKAAKMNKGTFEFDLNSVEKESNSKSNDGNIKSNYISKVIASVTILTKQLYGTKSMLKVSFIVPIIWFLSSIVYFGVPLNANIFTENPYLYIILIGTAEIPHVFLCPVMIRYFGNIKTGISLFLITGGCMLGTLLVPDHLWWMNWIFVMLSMTCIGAITVIGTLLISELFPTVLRSTGFGLSLSLFYFGQFLSTFMNSTMLSETWWAFNAICGVCCIKGAVLISLLPETNGTSLSETTDDVDKREARNLKY